MLMEIIFYAAILIVFYIYIGHYLAISLLSRKKNFKYNDNKKKLNFSIIIPVNQKSDTLKKKVDNTLDFNYPKNKFEIIIVDSNNGENDKIVKKFSSYDKKLKYLKQNGETLNNAINCGLKIAKGDLIVKTDFDTFLPKNSLNIFNNIFLSYNNIGVISASHDPAGSGLLNFYRKFSVNIRYYESLLGSTWIPGEFFAFRKNIVKKIPETKLIADDFYITLNSIKKGFRVISIKDVKAKEYDDYDTIEFLKRLRRWFSQCIYTALAEFKGITSNLNFFLISLKNLIHLTIEPLLILFIIFYLLTKMPYVLLLFLTLLTLLSLKKEIRYYLLCFLAFQIVIPISFIYAILRIEKW